MPVLGLENFDFLLICQLSAHKESFFTQNRLALKARKPWPNGYAAKPNALQETAASAAHHQTLSPAATTASLHRHNVRNFRCDSPAVISKVFCYTPVLMQMVVNIVFGCLSSNDKCCFICVCGCTKLKATFATALSCGRWQIIDARLCESPRLLICS